MKSVIKILSCLSMKALYALADYFLYPLLFYVVRYRRKLCYRNMRTAFPDWSEQQIRELQKRFYHHFVDVIVEIVRSYRASEEEMQNYIQFPNIAEIERWTIANGGLFFMLGHMGNWEFTADVQHRFLNPDIQHYNVYRRQRNASADSVMLHIREKRSGEGSCLEKNMLLRHLIRIRQTGKPYTLGLIADQKPSPKNQHYWTDFLHHDTSFLDGGEVLSRKFGAAVGYVHITKPQRGQYIARVDLITDRPNEQEANYITEQFARRLEANILEQPELWLWTHNRWKWSRDSK